MKINKSNRIHVLILIGVFLGAEIVSFIGFKQPMVNSLAFGLILLITLALTIKRLENGFLIIAGELLIGSLGHLFYLTVGDGRLSLRIGLWLTIMAIWGIKFLIQVIRLKAQSSYWQALKEFPWRRNFIWLGIFVLIGLANGLLRKNDLGTMLVDFNSWLYFLLLLPAISVYGRPSTEVLERLKKVFLAGAIFLSLKTLFFLYIFTHNSGLAPDIYSWLRLNLLGEMTPTKTGWPRIFLQSQIFSALAFFLIFWTNESRLAWKKIFKDNNYLVLLAAGFFLSTVVLSFSRSFWAGLLAGIGLSLIIIWRLFSWRKMISAGLWMASAALLSLAIIYLVAAFPYWRPSSGNLSETILARVSDGNEAALASRWSLLPVLTSAIKDNPLLGRGYGATVTYYSQDPRVLQNNPSGEYTTYIFEWSYLDLWLKLGALGLLIYLLLLGRLILATWRGQKGRPDYLALGLGIGLVFLAVTNIFTPYLNHPLGIGFLVISSCLIRPNRVY